MGKLKNNQNGFSGVEGVIVLAVIVLIGVVGYMVYNNHKKTTTASVAASTSPATTKTTAAANPYTGWQTYTDASGFTLKYPTTWADDTVKAGTTVRVGADQTPTVLTENAQGELTPQALSARHIDLIQVTTDTYTGTVADYKKSLTTDPKYTGGGTSGTASTSTSQIINGYQADYTGARDVRGTYFRFYTIYNKGKVAILRLELKTDVAPDGSAAQDYSQYTADEDMIAKSIQFTN